MALRTAAVGSVRILVDLVVVTFYVASFALARFVYRLWLLGHDLDPTAPVTVEPFTPAIVGTKQIANFTITSLPQPGCALVAIVVLGLIALLARQLWTIRDLFLPARHEEA